MKLKPGVSKSCITAQVKRETNKTPTQWREDYVKQKGVR